MAVVRRCHERMSEDCGRIACQIKMDWRQGHTGRLESKMATLRDKTGRDLST